jgi:hypothetical protein
VVIFGVIFAMLIAAGALVDFRTRAGWPSRDQRGFAVIEVLVVGTVLAITIATFIFAVDSVRSL